MVVVMKAPIIPSPLHILLVEDSKGDALLIDKMINQGMSHACTIHKANTLAAALQIISENEFDVALLDRSLPDVIEFSGLQNMQNMAPKLPIIFLTAYKDEAVALEAIEHGAQDYLFKDKMDSHMICRSIQFAVIRKQFETVLVTQANFDNLTGLANRMLFENRLQLGLARMKRQGGGVGVLFLDLNRFKQVNDTHGHAVGDRLLAEVGKRFIKCLRPYDTVARFGGDEFAVLVEGAVDDERCIVVAEKIIKQCQQPFMISNQTLDIGISVGISTCIAGQIASGQELMYQADKAMYSAKASGENNYRLWRQLPPDLQQSVA